MDILFQFWKWDWRNFFIYVACLFYIPKFGQNFYKKKALVYCCYKFKYLNSTLKVISIIWVFMKLFLLFLASSIIIIILYLELAISIVWSAIGQYLPFNHYNKRVTMNQSDQLSHIPVSYRLSSSWLLLGLSIVYGY